MSADPGLDTLVSARWVVPVEPAGQIIDHGAVLIRDGRIAEVGDSTALATAHPTARRVERPGHVLCPGFVNAHVHSAMTLLRGYADDQPLSSWLNDHIWPAEKRWVDENFVRDGTRLALCEMVRGGTTCINEGYFHPDVAARSVADIGLRARIGIIVLPFASSWARNAAEYLSKGLELRDEYRRHPAIGFTFAPHSVPVLEDATLRRIRSLADQLEEPVHIHVQESRSEMQESLARHGRRPLQHLAELGLVTPALQAIHMTQVDDEDIDLLCAGAAHVVHCPNSNLKLASGFCPVARLLERGINVALGSDGAASNNGLDMLAEMRSAALLAKGVAGSASVVSAPVALHMATLGGARALGWGDELGSLTSGKWADLVCVDLSHAATSPVYDPISTLVYAAGRQQVSDVWVAGRPLVSEGELIAADEQAIVARAAGWAGNIAGHRHTKL